MFRGKKYKSAAASVEAKRYSVEEAVALAQKTSYTKFDGTVEVHIKTNANPKYQDQLIRGTVVLPHGTGKSVKIAVFTTEDNFAAAKAAGADIVGHSDLISAIEAGKIEFEILVTTQDNVRDLAKVAKILGPKGLMPSPKAGTVTNDLASTINEIKKGRVEFKLDKTGNIHVGIGKVSFDQTKLVENFNALVHAIEEARPTGVKGKLFKKTVVAATMGPGIEVSN